MGHGECITPGLRATARIGVAAALWCSLIQAAAAQGAPTKQAEAGAPVALVIANAAYTAFPPRPGCEMSANLVAASLSRAGFKVLRQTNVSNARLGTAISALGEDGAAGRFLIYLCGYAVTYGERLFLLPIEARVEREADVLSQGIVARLLMSSVAGPGSEAGLVLLDVGPPPGRGTLNFSSMLRPADAAHGGLAAATLPTVEQAPAPLALAVAELVPAGAALEAGALLAALKLRPGLERMLLTVRAPAEPSWLLGGPAPAPMAVAAPAPIQPAIQPSVQPVPVQPAIAQSGPEPPPAAVVDGLADPNPAERRRLQLALQRLGYLQGRVDGTFGADTVSAIRRFQRDSNGDATGRLTVKQAEQLLR